MANVNPYGWIDSALSTIHRAGWYRQTRLIESLHENTVTINGKTLINFASNNYLGLATDWRVKQGAIQAIEQYGVGATSSRLVVGNYELHRQLETQISAWKGTVSTLVFSSGYMTNVGVIPALVGSRDVVFSDRYNHACLKNGIKLSGAFLLEYDHINYQHLAQLLQEHRQNYRRSIIITDTVFSMDGDIAPIREIMNLATEFNSMVLVDEAHGVGVFGATGAGVIEALGITTPLIQMGTLSKAIGSLGGYVTGDFPLITYLQNRASTWIYSTGLSLGDTGAALASIDIIQRQPELRERLWQNCFLLGKILGMTITSPIVPIICPTIDRAIFLSQELQNQGFLVPAIRPPTVPTPRLRISLMASHTPDQIYQLGELLNKLLQGDSFN
jgi:8-amino-7-oxononanoate synthase